MSTTDKYEEGASRSSNEGEAPLDVKILPEADVALIRSSYDAEAVRQLCDSHEQLRSWLQQVDDVLVVDWIDVENGDYRKALNQLVTYNIQLHDNPEVSSVAKERQEQIAQLEADAKVVWRKNAELQAEAERLTTRVDELLADNNVQRIVRRELERKNAELRARVTELEQSIKAERVRSRVMGLCEGFDAGASTELKQSEDELAKAEERIAELEQALEAERTVGCLLDDLQRENAELSNYIHRLMDTLHAIAVKGLGLPDPVEHQEPVWDGLLSDKVAALRAENAELRAQIREADAQIESMEKRGVWLTPDELEAARKAEEGR